MDRVTSPRPARRPATEISSSSASQCRPTRLSSTWLRSSGVAWSRRGNHASGIPSVLPSDSSTHIVCSSKRTLVAEMVMPSLQKKIAVVFHHARDSRKPVGWVEPLRNPSLCGTTDDVYRFAPPSYGIVKPLLLQRQHRQYQPTSDLLSARRGRRTLQICRLAAHRIRCLELAFRSVEPNRCLPNS